MRQIVRKKRAGTVTTRAKYVATAPTKDDRTTSMVSICAFSLCPMGQKMHSELTPQRKYHIVHTNL